MQQQGDGNKRDEDFAFALECNTHRYAFTAMRIDSLPPEVRLPHAPTASPCSMDTTIATISASNLRTLVNTPVDKCDTRKVDSDTQAQERFYSFQLGRKQAHCNSPGYSMLDDRNVVITLSCTVCSSSSSAHTHTSHHITSHHITHITSHHITSHPHKCTHRHKPKHEPGDDTYARGEARRPLPYSPAS